MLVYISLSNPLPGLASDPGDVHALAIVGVSDVDLQRRRASVRCYEEHQPQVRKQDDTMSIRLGSWRRT